MSADATQISGVILAAGMATRFGGDKLMQPLKGRPLYSYALKAALESELQGVVMVCGGRLAADPPRHNGLICVSNPRPQDGQAGSLKLGLSRVPAGSSHVLFMLADQPLITPELINRFCGLAREGAALACQGWRDYLGPPTLVGRELFAELHSLSGDRGAGSLLARHKDRLEVVPAPHPDLILDVDRPRDLAKIEKLMP
jgi:molybdenum cofactor cytidylyltransferase